MTFFEEEEENGAKSQSGRGEKAHFGGGKCSTVVPKTEGRKEELVQYNVASQGQTCHDDKMEQKKVYFFCFLFYVLCFFSLT